MYVVVHRLCCLSKGNIMDNILNKKLILLSFMDKMKHNILKHKRVREFKAGDQVVLCDLNLVTAKGDGEFDLNGYVFYRHPFATLPVLNKIPDSITTPRELEALFTELEESNNLIKELRDELDVAIRDKDRVQCMLVNIQQHRNRTPEQKKKDKEEISDFLSNDFY